MNLSEKYRFTASKVAEWKVGGWWALLSSVVQVHHGSTGPGDASAWRAEGQRMEDHQRAAGFRRWHLSVHHTADVRQPPALRRRTSGARKARQLRTQQDSLVLDPLVPCAHVCPSQGRGLDFGLIYVQYLCTSSQLAPNLAPQGDDSQQRFLIHSFFKFFMLQKLKK